MKDKVFFWLSGACIIMITLSFPIIHIPLAILGALTIWGYLLQLYNKQK